MASSIFSFVSEARVADVLGNLQAFTGLAIQLIDNILPWNLVLLRFLPLYAVLVLYKSSSYMDVPTSREMNYMIMATLATVVTPLVIYYFFFFLLP